MSTATVGGSIAQSATEQLDNFYTENDDVVYGCNIEKDEAGKITRTPAVYSVEKATKLAEAGKFDGETGNAGIVTVRVRYPKTLSALLELADTDEKKQELVNNHNRGAKTKLNNRTDAKLLARDADGNFTLTEKDAPNNILDMSDEILAETKRKSLSPDERFAKFVATMNFTPEQAEKMRATWLSFN